MTTLSLARVTSIAVVALGLLVAARPAAAQCSTRHMTLFELHDVARDVAVATVRAGQPPSRSGPVELDVHEAFKGAAAATLQGRENGSCTAGLRTGKEVLVFLGADGLAVGFWSGVVDLPAPAIVDAIRAWRDARTDGERVEVLVAAMESADPVLAADAGYYLADEPALLVAIDPAHAARIAARAGGVQWGPEIILTRLHGPELAALVRGRGLPRDLRAIARHRFEGVTDPAALALAMARARGDLPRRVAALERCERVHARRLERFSNYNGRALGEAIWRVLTTACRTGAPPTAAQLEAAGLADEAAARRRPGGTRARRW